MIEGTTDVIHALGHGGVVVVGVHVPDEVGAYGYEACPPFRQSSGQQEKFS